MSKFIDGPSKDQRARLFQCAADPQFRVAAPAMMLLDKLPVDDKQLGEWLSLHAPDLAARRFAINKVGDKDTAEVAEKLVEQLQHPDRKFRGDVLAKLAGLRRAARPWPSR